MSTYAAMLLETFDCTVGLVKAEKDLISPVFLFF